MFDSWILVSITVLGMASYALRSGGFLAAGLLRNHSGVARVFRLAPGNLFVAFVAAACLEGGSTSVAGCASALILMATTRKEWLALAAAFVVTALTAGMHVQ